MYAKSAYHDVHYVECESPHYRESAALLTKFLPAGASVLDYGCGLGLFLRALDEQGFSATGVEFDREAAEMAAKVSRRPAYALEELAERQAEASLDALHLGDVLEHLGDPAKTLDALLSLVKPGGLLFVEGPLENNPSPVYWSARLAGAMKRFLKRGFVGSGAPTHLLRVDGAQQQAFFERYWPQFETLHWSVYETGWPYKGGGAVKNVDRRSCDRDRRQAHLWRDLRQSISRGAPPAVQAELKQDHVRHSGILFSARQGREQMGSASNPLPSRADCALGGAEGRVGDLVRAVAPKTDPASPPG